MTNSVYRTEIYSNGNIDLGANSDVEVNAARTALYGSNFSDYAYFGHYDLRNTTNAYAVLQSHSGDTLLNAYVGRKIYFAINNQLKGTLSSAGLWGFGTTSPTAGYIATFIGKTKFGSTSNYSEFEADGTLEFNGDAVVWDDQQVNLSMAKFWGTNVPTWVTYRGSQVLAFSKNGTDKASFIIQFSHRLKTGSDIEFHVHTVAPDNNSGDVRWDITVSMADIGDDFPAETTYSLTQSIAANSQNEHLYTTITTDMGSSDGVSAIALMSITRNGGHADDDYNNDIYLIALDAHIQIDTVGSRAMTTK